MTLVAAPLLALLVLLDQPTLAGISKEALELKGAFNKANGRVRMILIVSPG
jgi:hypothetical protein